MELFICGCGWTFVVGKKKVVGPFIPQMDDTAREMKRKEWEYQYSDCVGVYKRRK